MQVILLKDIPGLGREGELKAVSDGYGRNYLLPKKLAILATPQEIEKWKFRQEQKERQQQKDLEQATMLKEKIESLHMEPSLPAKEGKPFGSLRKEDVVEFLAMQGISISKDAVKLDQPIKKAGEYAVLIALHPKISATLKITVLLSPQP